MVVGGTRLRLCDGVHGSVRNSDYDVHGIIVAAKQRQHDPYYQGGFKCIPSVRIGIVVLQRPWFLLDDVYLRIDHCWACWIQRLGNIHID